MTTSRTRRIRPSAATKLPLINRLIKACSRYITGLLHSPYGLFRRRATARALSKLGVFHKCYVHSHSLPSEQWYRWGFGADDMQFDNWLSQLHPDDREWVLEEFERQTAAGDVVQLPEYRIRSSAGEERWILSKGAVASRDAHGRVKSYFGIDFDITRRKETERQLSRTKEKLESRLEEIEVLRKAGSIITSTLDTEEVVRHVLEQARRMVPYETASVMELDGNVLRIINGRGWAQGDEIRGLELPYPGRNPNTMVMRNGKPLIIHEPTRYYPLFRILGIDDVRSWMGVPLVVQGRIIGMITFDSRAPHAFTINHMRLAGMLAEHIAVAIHNARRFEKKRVEASTDPLTEIYNRRRWYGEAKRYIERADSSGEPFALLMIDIDFFKEVNDTYGHAAGDTVLRAVSDLCRRNLRPFDLFGRYGGEEFVVILPNTGKRDGYRTAERLRSEVHADFAERQRIPLSISVGVAAHPEDTPKRPADGEEGAAGTEAGARLSELLDAYIDMADKALYRAKKGGRNRVEIYSPSSFQNTPAD